MLYIFAGFPRKVVPVGSQSLNAGGLQYCIEAVEELAVLEHDPHVQYRKAGVFSSDEESGEWLYPVEHHISELCLQDGITWEWFKENWEFGNGVTVHKTMASPEYRTVVHGTDLTMDEFLGIYNRVKLSELELVRKHNRHEGWEKYEARWLPGTCPQENHVVHLTWLVTDYKLPEFVYSRIQDLIERGAQPKDPHLYSAEPGKHFSTTRIYDGKPAFRGRQ